jgi:hypothetical protein
MGDPTGEAKSEALRLDFDRRLMLRFRGSVITSDDGLLAYRELDDAVGLTDTGADTLADARTEKNGRHLLGGLLRQSLFGRLAGYEDVNDADRLCRDPAMCWVVGDRAIIGCAASASQMGRFETEWQARPENLTALADLPGQWVDNAPAATAQDRRARHGFEREPDLWRTGRKRLQRALRLHVLSPAVRVQPTRRCRAVRFAVGQRAQRRRLARGARAGGHPLLGHRKASLLPGRCGLRQSRDLRFLEAEGIGYTIRLPANRVLQDRIGY